MTVQFALDYIPRRMRELGYGDHYITRFRHLMLKPAEIVTMESYAGEFLLLIEPTLLIRVDSELGRYNMSSELTNEQQYEHQGYIEIENLNNGFNHIRFIQVIPLHKSI